MKKVVLNEQALTGITVYEIAPVGTIMAYGGTSIPVGYLSCNGQAISRTDYADLFSKIGTTYGSGDGTSTFNVPSISSSVEGVTQIIKATNNVPLTSNAIDDSKTTVGNTWSAQKISKWQCENVSELPYTATHDGIIQITVKPNTSAYSYLYMNIARGDTSFDVPANSNGGLDYNICTPIMTGDVITYSAISNVKAYITKVYYH